MKQILLACLCLISSCGLAQSLSGKIIGTKTEPISRASIRLLNTNYTTISQNDGSFSFPKISAGIYTLQVRALGFATQNQVLSIENAQNLVITLQELTLKLDEVVVTAEKVEQIAQKLPLALSVITSKQIEDYRLWSVKDLSTLIPNLTIANPGDGKNNMSLRGIASASYDQPIATYVDGVNQIRLDAYIPQLLDVERIEVLRGPQGTLYGRNAMGGVINIITKQPDNEFKKFGEISFANYGQQRHVAGVRLPLIKDKLFIGVTFLHEKQGGFFTNIFNNTKFDKAQSVMGNYFLKYKASNHLSITANLKHYNRQNDGSFPLVNSAAQAFLTPFQVNYNAVATDHDNTLNASLVANYYGETFDLTSITAFQSNTRYYSAPIDADVQLPFQNASLDVNSIEIKNDNGENTVKFWTQELRLNSSTKQKSSLKWTAGSFFFTQNDPTVQSLLVGTDGAKFGQAGGPYKVETDAQQNNYALAFYGQISYNLSPKLDLTGGFRYDDENQKLTVGSKFIKGTYIKTTQKDTTGKTNFKAFSPKVAVNYHLSTDKVVYASFTRGYRAGGLTQIGYDPSEAPLVAYKPEFSNNFEIGLKTTTWENKLRANLAFFLTTVTDAQVPTLLPALGFRTATSNAGNLKASGVEIEIAAMPLKGLQIDYNFGYTDAHYTILNLPVTENGSKILKNYANNRQILTPDRTSMLGIQYSFPITKSIKFVAHAEWKHVGTQYFDLKNTFTQEAYELLNARMGVSTKHLDLMFWGRNLANKTYIAYGYSFGAATLGNPQTMGLTLLLR